MAINETGRHTLTGMVEVRCACCRDLPVIAAPDNTLNARCPDCEERVMECCAERGAVRW